MPLTRVIRNASRLSMHRNPMPPPPVRPLALSDSEYDQVVAACRPLHPDQRGAFLEALAAELRDAGELGDGKVHRVIAQVQRQFWDPPDLDGPGKPGKYS
jgi:hypothetical protein